jgi:ParB-like chromosome segregation protein Spo0J
MSKPPLAIEQLQTTTLRPYARNARTHSPKQIAQIAASIREFGFNNPVLLDREGEIIAGHGRVAAAKKLGLDTVPCIRLEHLNDAQKRAYILADNRLAEKAGWDRDILAIELQFLTEIEVDFDVTLTGFEMGEVDLLLGAGQDAEAKADPADAVPEVTTGAAATRPGDVWQIGRHRLICGDSLEAETYDRLLAGEKAQLVFTDPPYNVKIDGHVSGLGA